LRRMDEDRGHLLNDFVDGLRLLAVTMSLIVIVFFLAHSFVTPVIVFAP
jgi:hypothetical protein